MGTQIKIAPSILSADFSKLGEEVSSIDSGGADYIHVDVMDGHFVPNLTIGLPVVAALRQVTQKPLDVHLMIERPGDYVTRYADAGADLISVHVEAATHLHRVIYQIKDAGAKASVAINPATPVSHVYPVLADIDMVLIMTVNPGFGGQSFIDSSYDKIRTLRSEINRQGLTVDIEVDGGIKAGNIGNVAEAGANVFVSGSGVFSADNYEQRIAELKAAAIA